MGLFDRAKAGEDRFLPQVGTLSGNPMAAVAGLATLEVLKRPGTYQQVFATGRKLMDTLSGLLRDTGLPGQVIGEPPLFDLFFATGDIPDYRASLRADTDMMRRFNQRLRASGVLKGDSKCTSRWRTTRRMLHRRRMRSPGRCMRRQANDPPVSLAAHDPQNVAQVLAELMGGRCYPFPGGIADSFIAVSGDAHGTAVEVYPDGMRLRPDGANAVRGERTRSRRRIRPVPSAAVGSHFATTIEQIGKREGWTARLCGRGAPGQKPLFHVIEFWLENRVMVEVVPQEMIGDYERLLQFP